MRYPFGKSLLLLLLFTLPATQVFAALPAAALDGFAAPFPWWGWSILLLVGSFVLGIVAVMAGIGGAVLFVPLVTTFFPFHLDYVRGASLLVALAAALSSTPHYVRQGFTSLPLVLPMACFSSLFAVLGALTGLLLPRDLIRITLGVTIIFICVVMLLFGKDDLPAASDGDGLSNYLRMNGAVFDETKGVRVNWFARNTLLGLVLFGCAGFMAGMFGLGAGWANVPIFNLVLGIPLKVSVACSMLLIAVSDTAAVWIYLNKGAVLAPVAVPSVVGVVLGSRVGVRLFSRAAPRTIRLLVIALLALAGFSSLLKGLNLL